MSPVRWALCTRPGAKGRRAVRRWRGIAVLPKGRGLRCGEALLPAPVGVGRFVIRATRRAWVGVPPTQSLTTATREANSLYARRPTGSQSYRDAGFSSCSNFVDVAPSALDRGTPLPVGVGPSAAQRSGTGKSIKYPFWPVSHPLVAGQPGVDQHKPEAGNRQ